MQRKVTLRTVAGLSLLVLAGCNSQPESTGSTTTVVEAPAPAPEIKVETAPPVIVKTEEKPKAAPTKADAKAAKTTTTTTTIKKTVAPTAKPKPAAKLGPIPKEATKLIVEDIAIGAGPTATPGKMVSVHYTGTLTNGTKIDSSLDSGAPFEFPLGAGQVIRGWDQGVAGMKVGGKRRLIIPSDLGYGPDGSPPVIPPNATLVFTVELLGVQ